MGSELENIGGTTNFGNLDIKDTKVISKSLRGGAGGFEPPASRTL